MSPTMAQKFRVKSADDPHCTVHFPEVRDGYAADAEDLQAEFTRVCYPLYSATPGWAEESAGFWPG